MLAEPCPVCEKINWKRSSDEKFWECGFCNGEKNDCEKIETQKISELECGHTAAQWRPLGQEVWYCSQCTRPPSRALVAEWRELGSPEPNHESITLVESLLIGYPAPVCRSCGCRTTIETHWSDGSTEERCECCGSPAQWETRPRWEGRPFKPMCVRASQRAS